jgi:hypothetical protein
MASRAQIARLAQRIEALAPPPSARIAVIFMRDGESEQEVAEQHYRKHPDDRQALHTLFVRFVDPKRRRGSHTDA